MRDPRRLQAATEEAHDIPWIGPLFVVAYGVLAALALPITPLSIMAGAIFGWLKGMLFVWLASVLGATGGYWIARLVGGQFLKTLLRKHHDAVDRLDDPKRAFLPVLRMQLLPVTPFGLVNAASAAAGVRFFPFIGATAIGVLPGAIAYVFVGDRLRAGLGGGERHAVMWASVIAVVLIALSFIPMAMRRRR